MFVCECVSEEAAAREAADRGYSCIHTHVCTRMEIISIRRNRDRATRSGDCSISGILAGESDRKARKRDPYQLIEQIESPGFDIERARGRGVYSPESWNSLSASIGPPISADRRGNCKLSPDCNLPNAPASSPLAKMRMHLNYLQVFSFCRHKMLFKKQRDV